jgi:hypothetical protein
MLQMNSAGSVLQSITATRIFDIGLCLEQGLKEVGEWGPVVLRPQSCSVQVHSLLVLPVFFVHQDEPPPRRLATLRRNRHKHKSPLVVGFLVRNSTRLAAQRGTNIPQSSVVCRVNSLAPRSVYFRNSSISFTPFLGTYEVI